MRARVERRSHRGITATVVASTVAVVLFVSHSRAQEPERTIEHYYVPTSDGFSLSVTVNRPTAPGAYPVLLTYGVYGDGEIAFLDGGTGGRPGVAFAYGSAPGSGCSSGRLEFFGSEQARAGAELVEWAGTQTWSNGRVVMTGNSYLGIGQFFVAALKPSHLVAINPNHTHADMYRDGAYPGGIPNTLFGPFWNEGARVQNESRTYPSAIQKDETCRSRAVDHELNRHEFSYEMILHPYDDEWHRIRSPIEVVDDIEVPVLMTGAWQDGFVQGAISKLFEVFAATRPRDADGRIDPPVLLRMTNGRHPDARAVWGSTVNRFFDRYLHDDPATGIDDEAPVSVAFETVRNEDGSIGGTPSFVLSGTSLPLDDSAYVPLYLRGDGSLDPDPPGEPEADRTYVYPAQPHVRQPQERPSNLFYDIPSPFSLRYDSAPMARDMIISGPIELRFHATTTAPDTDFEVILSEIRPDGTQVYLQKGMLRASHRYEDVSRSRIGEPYHPHQTSEPVIPGVAAEYAIAIWPVAERLSTGSRLRLELVAPFLVQDVHFYSFTPLPSVNTIHSTPDRPGVLLLPMLEAPEGLPVEPACNQLLGQHCRRPPFASLSAP